MAYPEHGGRKRKKRSLIPVLLAIVVNAVAFAAPAFADENEWVYDTSERQEIVPASDFATHASLDAKARGFDVTVPATVDKWFLTWCFSNELSLDFSSPGFLLLLK